MLIDTHVHYNLEPFFSNTEEKWRSYWQKAQEHGIQKSIVVGADFITSTIATQVAENTDGLFASIGCHPGEYQNAFQDAQNHKVSTYDSLFEDVNTDRDELGLLVGGKKVVAIGETGLDYYRLPKEVEDQAVIIRLQKHAFESQIELAQKHELPLILHVRDKELPEQPTKGNAYWDALSILQAKDVKQFTLHCVSGPLSYVKAAIEMGGYMGFDGNISYPNAQHIRDIFKLVPENRRLVETDAPFLPPQEFRGKICEPWMLSKTVEYIVQVLKVDENSFTENAERLFPLS